MRAMTWPGVTLALLLFGVQHHVEIGRLHTGVQGHFVIPGLSRKRYVQLGDINIGFLQDITGNADDGELLCIDVLTSPMDIRYSEAMKYAVERFNQDHPLPNNLTLGFAIVNDCYKETASAAQAMAFVPQTTCQAGPPDPDGQPSYDVVGVIGSSYSTQSIAAAHVLGAARIPQISIYSTSDDLSNKWRFPYFLRTVPPDRFQFRAIFSLIQRYSWSYVSVIYLEGSYGENGFKQLRDLLDGNGICLAAVHKTPSQFTESQAQVVADDLVAHRKARVVVMIVTVSIARKVITATRQRLPAGTFTWIASDALSSSIDRLTDLADMLLDSFVFNVPAAYVPDFEEWFLRLKPENTSNPWFPDYWEKLFDCSFDNQTCDASLAITDANSSFDRPATVTGHVIDAVFMFGHATARVLQSTGCSGQGATASACVTGPRLLSELKATRHHGYTGWLELDSNGDRLGRYVISQVRPATGQSDEKALALVEVAEFDSLTGRMSHVSNVSWVHHQSTVGLEHPQSRCSHPCNPHQARVVQEVTCCWFCVPCRPNERLAFNASRCEACSDLSWPDPDQAYTVCLSIPPLAPQLDSATGVMQTALAVIGLIASVVVFVFFHRHRQCRVIKASSRELSFLMLLAISLGYITVMALLAPPNDVTCRISFTLFCVSFTLIYGPLFVRALRIFRIFDAGKRSSTRPRMIDTSHQVFFSFVLLGIQVVMCIVLMVVYPGWHKLTQSSPQEQYVELTCDLPLAGLASFLAYNLLLVVLCTLLAFKTRHLPDNFNESRFISMCVSTTLVLFVCFIPAYLVSGRELLKMLMLALALGLNHTVALVFLFLPKIYAVLYLQGAADPLRTVAGVGTTLNTRVPVGTVGISQAGSVGRQGKANSEPQISISESDHAEVQRTLPAPNFNQVYPST